MVIDILFWVDLSGWRRIGEEMGTPWKEDWSKKLVFALVEMDVVKVVAMAAIGAMKKR